MKLMRFTYAVLLVAIALLVYVRQRVELMKTGYEIQKNEIVYLELLDQNRILDYNVNVLKSPSSLERFLKATNKDYKSASKDDIVRLSGAQDIEGADADVWHIGRNLASVFNLKSQAEATTGK